MRTVFMGSPEFAVPTLRVLAEKTELVCVVTQPDRHAGRGRRLAESPVKAEAVSLDLEVFQPESLKDELVKRELQAKNAGVFIVAAYGKILPGSLLRVPPHGVLNVHASLLPRWRGAAPVQAAIASGDQRTGVTIMKMDEGLDTGPIIDQRHIPIAPDATGGALTKKLAKLGAELLSNALPAYLSGESEPQPQEDAAATYAPMLRKSDGFLDLSLPAATLERMIRAYDPWPGTYLEWEGRRLAIHKASVAKPGSTAPLGFAIELEGSPAVITQEGALLLEIVQLPGKRRVTGTDFLNGARGFLGHQLVGSQRQLEKPDPSRQ